MLQRIKINLAGKKEIIIPPAAKERILKARALVETVIAAGKIVYGINTGFGKLSSVRIPADQLTQLQINLLRSHACGVDDPIDIDVVKIMMILKVHNLSVGNSGVSFEAVEKIAELYNKGIYPVVPRRGSVGASGDLAPLAHMSLPLIGEGEVFYNNERVESEDLVKQGVYRPANLGAKDGLSLINGTQYSTALLVYAYLEAEKIVHMAELALALSIEADLATDKPFDERIHILRRQKGQMEVAENVRKLLKYSKLVESHKDCNKVQDPYCYRCAPQVIGSVRDTLNYIKSILEKEVEAVTDNPLVFVDEEEIISAGNFHAEPIAMAADYLSIAMTELGNISERRTANLIDTTMSGLPPFLIESSGLNSGFMIAQVTAAALTAENRTLANPASVQTIPTSANQEDHVSMAPNAGLKLLQIMKNVKQIIWIEMLAATQGIDFRGNLKGGIGTQMGYDKIRSLVKHLDYDRTFYKDLNRAEEFFRDEEFYKKLLEVINN
ncbi:MAG: histidine ammonia-lyase [Candidatus Marinimicrobia bacterium]|nr:histidine ammonia-lyase [Candidatus Neomarinimicrobiota bacterium]